MRTDQNVIEGQWAGAASGKVFDVMNPATDEVVARVPEAGATDLDKAVSDIGRGVRPWGAGEYLQVKQVHINLNEQPIGWY